MFKRSLLAVALLVPVGVSAAVYKWVDAEGNVHYSDQRIGQDAKAVKLPKSSVYSPREIEQQREQEEEAERSALASGQITISQPAADATVRSNEGNVAVSIDLGAPLEDGRYWTLTLDGRQAGERQSTTSVTVQNVERGVHQLQATLYDAKGQRLGQSDPVSFHLRRESRLAPNRVEPEPLPAQGGNNAGNRPAPLPGAPTPPGPANPNQGTTQPATGGNAYAPRFNPSYAPR